ncbi:MAG: hypothetical protein FWC80_01600 [Firmicutes bacterium]|nr:hypothetical protein [Bacillota bacterium]
MRNLNTKKLKTLTYGVMGFLLSIALAIGAWSWLPIARVSAAPATGPSVSLSTATSFNLPERRAFGGSVVFDATEFAGMEIEVTKPSGDTEAYDPGDTLHLNQIGTFNIRLSRGGAFFHEFNVVSFLRDEPILFIEQNGAGVPTIMEVDGTMSNLPTTSWADVTNWDYVDDNWPQARLVYIDDNGREHPIRDGANNPIEVNIRAMGSNNIDNVDRDTVFTNQGRTWIEFYAQIGVDSEGLAGKVLSQDFEVSIRPTFNPTEPPRITVVGVPATASIRTRVTLPVATATDLHDTRIRFDIEVRDPNGRLVTQPGRDSICRDTDFVLAYPAAVEGIEGETAEQRAQRAGFTNNPVRFDNDRNRHFYPHMNGDFIVTFVAINHLGIRSTVRTSRITVSDRTAPTFVDIEDWRIPTEWGRTNVTNEAGASVGTQILIPVPTVVDNYTETPTVELIIRNPQGNDVIRFGNIKAEGVSARNADYHNLAAGGIAGGTTQTIRYWLQTAAGTFAESAYDVDGAVRGFLFNPALYEPLDTVRNSITGMFVVEYRARDAAGNIATQRFNIDIRTAFTDDTLPTVRIPEMPSFLTFNTDAPTSFVIPQPIVSDNSATRLRVQYLMSVGGVYVLVNGGERMILDGATLSFDPNTVSRGLAIVTRNATTGAITVVNELITDEEIRNPRFGGNLIPYDEISFRLTAWDSVGNYRYVSDDNRPIIRMADQNDAGSFTLNSTHTINARQTGNGDRVELRNNFAVDANGVYNNRFVTPIFSIGGLAEGDRLTGFEVAIYEQRYNEDDNDWDTPIRIREQDVIFRFIQSGTSPAINIYEISYTPNIGNVAGNLGRNNHINNRIFISVRAFNASGDNQVARIALTGIQARFDGSNVGGGSSNVNINMPSNLAVMTWTDMNNNWFYDNAGAIESYILRRIESNGFFSVMGNRFRASTTGSFNISYFRDTVTNLNDRGAIAAAHTITVNNAENPIIIRRENTPNFLPRSVAANNNIGDVLFDGNGEYDRAEVARRRAEGEAFLNDPNDPFNPDSPFALYIDGARNPNANPFYPYVRLPAVNASSMTGATNVTVSVTLPGGGGAQATLYSVVPTSYHSRTSPHFRSGNPVANVLDRVTHRPNDYVTGDIFFRPTVSGVYTITFRPFSNGVEGAPEIITIVVGNVVPPNLTVEGTHASTMRIGDTFTFLPMSAAGIDYRGTAMNPETFTFTKEVRLDNVLLTEWTVSGLGTDSATAEYRGTAPTIETAGRYEVTYRVVDEDGNIDYVTFVITVSATSARRPLNTTVLSVVLSIIGILVIVGLVFYFIKFRKIKE